MQTARGPFESVLVVDSARPRPLPARFAREWSFGLVATDVAIAVLAVVAAANLTGRRLDLVVAREGAVPALLCAFALALILFERIGVYRRTYSTDARDEVYAALAACAMAMLPSLGMLLLLPALTPDRRLLVGATFLTACGLCASRFGSHVLRTRFFPVAPRRIAVIGTPERIATIPDELSLRSGNSVVRLSVEDFDGGIARAQASGRVTDLEWLDAALARGCDELIVIEALPPEFVAALLAFTEPRRIRVAFAPTRFRPHAYDFTVRRDGGIALIYPQSLAICTPGAQALRRVIDLAIAIPATVLLAPLLCAIAVAVAVDGGRPIVYRQTRVGRANVPFEILKFRTMRPDAEANSGPIWAQAGEDRTTRVGRFLRRTSLDELPQLINVIRGEMSVVGPRPERPYYVERFRALLPRYDERHLVRPGITGWSHVHMARTIEPSQIGERLSYDLFYLEHWSVFMDLTILCKTIAEFLFHSPA